MDATPLERQFAGQARLVRLLLWRIGDATDMDVCFATAKELGMIDDADERFLRTCLDAEERQRTAGTLDMEPTADTIARLRRCADKLNRADAA